MYLNLQFAGFAMIKSHVGKSATYQVASRTFLIVPKQTANIRNEVDHGTKAIGYKVQFVSRASSLFPGARRLLIGHGNALNGSACVIAPQCEKYREVAAFLL